MISIVVVIEMGRLIYKETRQRKQKKRKIHIKAATACFMRQNINKRLDITKDKLFIKKRIMNPTQNSISVHHKP